ncbi:MAG: outer membrane beta-barrel protein [Gammaproteobacteria bacterium]
MKGLTLALILVSAAFVSSAIAADEFAEVKVVDPYLEMHTGPGGRYPIFYVVDRDEFVEVLKRKTDWFEIRTRKGKLGWVDRAQMEKTLTSTGKSTEFVDVSFDDFSNRRWELGLVGGIFNSAPVMTLYGGYALMQKLSVELSISQVVGEFSSSQLLNVNLMAQPFNEWRYSPFFTLGLGHIETKPRVTLIQAQDSSDFVAHVGFGVKAYLTKRFILRAEFKKYVGFSSDDDNKDFQEWKAGFGFFF